MTDSPVSGPVPETIGPSGVSKSGIRPSDVRFVGDSEQVHGGFGHRETEVAAGQLVIFCREQLGDTWKPFRVEEAMRFYLRNGWNADNGCVDRV